MPHVRRRAEHVEKEEDLRHILREEKGDDPDARVCVDDLLRCEIYQMKRGCCSFCLAHTEQLSFLFS